MRTTIFFSLLFTKVISPCTFFFYNCASSFFKLHSLSLFTGNFLRCFARVCAFSFFAGLLFVYFMVELIKKSACGRAKPPCALEYLPLLLLFLNPFFLKQLFPFLFLFSKIRFLAFPFFYSYSSSSSSYYYY